MLPYLSAYMGHADLRGTQYYLQLTADAYPELVAMVQARFGYVIPNPAASEGADYWEVRLDKKALPFLDDHRIEGMSPHCHLDRVSNHLARYQ